MIKKTFLLVISLFVFGCSATDNLYSDTFYINEFEGLIGKPVSDLETFFGKKNVSVHRLPAHEPETYLSATKVTVEKGSFIVIGDKLIRSILFQSSFFQTRDGVKVGQSYCSLINTYPNARFSFRIEENKLQLNIKNLVLDFETFNLPFGKYIVEGNPSKNDKTFCVANLSSIRLSHQQTDRF